MAGHKSFMRVVNGKYLSGVCTMDRYPGFQMLFCVVIFEVRHSVLQKIKMCVNKRSMGQGLNQEDKRGKGGREERECTKGVILFAEFGSSLLRLRAEILNIIIRLCPFNDQVTTEDVGGGERFKSIFSFRGANKLDKPVTTMLVGPGLDGKGTTLDLTKSLKGFADFAGAGLEGDIADNDLLVLLGPELLLGELLFRQDTLL